MANNKKKNNKKTPVSTKPQGFKTKSTNKKGVGAAVVAGAAAGSSSTIVIISIIASVVLVILSLVGIYFVSGGGFNRSDKEINYLKANLNKYISFENGAYKNIEVDIPLLEYDDEQLERRINALLVQNKDKTPKNNGFGMISTPITLGDVVKIYYRGYKVDEDGKQVAFDGSSNFTDETPYSLEVGSATFIPGFEEALIGVVPGDYATFSAIYSGSVSSDMVVYISYTALYPDGTSATATSKRFDLANTDIDAELGEGFLAMLVGDGENAALQIGEKVAAKTFPYGEGSAGYTDIVVNYATKCEGNPYTIDVTFPADYGEASLRGVAVKFDIFPSSVVVYDIPEYNDEFLTETLKVNADDYANFPGQTLAERYKASLKEQIELSLEVANITLISDVLWETFKKEVKVKKLPKQSVNKYYNSYYSEIQSYYQNNSSYFTSIDAAAINYLGLGQDADWRAYITEMAEDAVIEKLIFYYIIRKEDFIPSRSEYNETYEKLYNEHLASYIETNGSSLSGLEGSQYTNEYNRLKAEMDKQYTEDYFKECVYYEYGTRKMAENLAIIK